MNREAIEQAKRINLISFLEQLGFRPSWQSGERAMFFSPLREEKNPSFYVQRFDGCWMWKDWGTGEKGDIINFIELYYGIDFAEAVRRLDPLQTATGRGVLSPEDLRTSQSPKTCKRDSREVGWVKEFYRKRAIKMNLNKMEVVRGYFLRRGVRYYPEMKCILVNDWKEKKLYVGIPVPFPLKMRGLELREIDGDSRKTWGRKTLWLLKRNPRRVLVTESVLDALAGELVIGDDSITLCSLNGVCNVDQLGDLFVQYRPREVIMALDADEPGRKAAQEAIDIAKRHLVPVVEFTDHLDAGVKDLHRLLMLEEESKHGRYDLSQVRRALAVLQGQPG
jgi:hypothetical protein